MEVVVAIALIYFYFTGEYTMRSENNNVYKLAMTGVLSAVATILMFLSFSVPFMPSFLKLDFSEMPALIASFALGPVSGVTVCLVKNLVNVFFSTTGGIGELCNFLLGVFFVLPAGIFYRLGKTRKNALIGSMIGACSMALLSLPLNYFVTYPIYAKFMPIDTIIGMYREIFPNVDGLLSCLIIFNVPFTLLKGAVDVLLTFLIYKRISWIFKGKRA